MTHTHTASATIMQFVDRFALSVLNGIALVGVPLVVLGLLTR